jgi:Domain of unknown function (DUF3644)
LAPRPRWHRILQESRRQACVAIDFYNKPGAERSYLDFVVHMHLAWQYLLHAECERQKQDYRYRDSRTGKLQKTREGECKTWDLYRCLEWRYPLPNDPIRTNVEFFIALRNKIEHRYQDSLMLVTAGQAHAYVLNYEAEVNRAFGPEQSLCHYLRFPLFIQSLSPAGMEEKLAIQRGLPRSVKSFITKFERDLSSQIRNSDHYDYRIMLVPVKGSRSEADIAMSFVRAEDLTEEKRAEMEAEGKIGTGVVIEKHRDVMHSDELSPAEALALIQKDSPFRLNMWHFTELVRHHKVKPPKGCSHPEQTNRMYCMYDKPWKKYVYTQAFVYLAIKDVAAEETFRQIFGKDPVEKASAIGSHDTRALAGAAH